MKKIISAFKKYWLGGVIVIVLLLAAVGVGYTFWHNRTPPATRGQEIPLGESISVSVGETGAMTEENVVPIQLSAGKPQPVEAESSPLVAGEQLTNAEIAQILARLPEFASEPADQADFRLAQEPIPPPRPGETLPVAFPPAVPPVEPPTVETGPLEVLRYAPEGEIAIAPFLSVTFNQPMVPVGTLADLAEQDIPVKVNPQLPGTWRWLGTRTLTFEYDSELIDRLPKATVYTVRVPAGTRSATGGELAQAVEWTFSTPPPVVTAFYPNYGPQPLEPLFFISFDQRVDPAAVLETVSVQAGGQPAALKLATAEEIEQDPVVKGMAKNASVGRWVAFRLLEPLPVDADVSITVGPGTPSAEGPLTSQTPYSYSFRTYAPLRIVEHGCSWGDTTCRPLTPFFIRFNNPLNPQSYSDGMLKIEPELPGASVNIVNDTLQIYGATKGRSTYWITVSGEVEDAFGQKLGADERLSFKVGPAESQLLKPDEIFVTLDPASQKPVYSVYVVNYPRLKVKIYRVQPQDWPKFQTTLRDYNWNNKPLKLPGTVVFDGAVPVESAADTLAQVDIDLSRYMDGKFGHFIVVVEPPSSLLKNKEELFWQTIFTWVQVTHIGLDAFADHSEMVAWATDLKDGSPLEEVAIAAGAASGGTSTANLSVTDASGMARFPVPAGSTYLTARQGADQALLPRGNNFWDDSTWSPWPVSDRLAWYVFDDRSMYRPGEEVHFKGWLRRVGGDQTGDVGSLDGRVKAVNYTVNDPQGIALGQGRAEVNALGGFDFVFTIPQAVNLGPVNLYLSAEGNLSNLVETEHYHTFQVQEFRRPEFEVNAWVDTPGPYFAGGTAVTAVEAKYYAGDPLPNADVTWTVTSSPGQYQPPNWPDFIFGDWQPWWSYQPMVGSEMSKVGYNPESGQRVETFTGVTDVTGKHYLRLDFPSAAGAETLIQPRPVSVHAEATVMDVNRQAWTARTDLLVHPADLYVGLRSDTYFVQRGDPLLVDVIVADLDGNPIADRPVVVEAARLEWKQRGGSWTQEPVDVQTCRVGSQTEPVRCTFETPLGGEYRITAQVTDSSGRLNQTQFSRWVSGGQMPPSRKVELEQVTLIPDKETYQPGDTALVLVQAPFSQGEGLLTVNRSGRLYTERFTLEDGAATLKIPIQEAYIPNIILQVDVVGSAPRTDARGEVISGAPARPAYATGQLKLSVPPLQRTLAVSATLQEAELEPGGETTLSVLVKDSQGQPVAGAEVAVVVVDEAILALTNYRLADPVSIFYTERSPDLDSRYARASLVLADPLALLQNQGTQSAAMVQEVEKSVASDGAREDRLFAAPMAPAPTNTAASGEASAPGGAPPPIRLRSDFNPLAVFAPQERTTASGEAVVQVKLPDNLTRYRVMVVVVDQDRQFGSAEANLTARLPLMVRPSAPRFLNFGDQFELPVVVQNQTGADMSVEVVVQAANLELLDSTGEPLPSLAGEGVTLPAGQQLVVAGQRVTVPAHDRVEVRFPARTALAGTARLQISVVSSGSDLTASYSDAASVELPVYTPATTEAFATYGVVDSGSIAQPVAIPSTTGADGVYPQYGGLDVQTSSTALQSLTDAVLYLVAYPFECSEQLASRVLAVAALRDVLDAFQAEGLPPPAEIEAAVDRDIARLQGMQNADGGFPYWRKGFDSIPFNTIHVAHALVRARQMGFDVPESMVAPALAYLSQVENYYPFWYDQYTRQTLSAYALYVRDLSGDADPQKALKLLDQSGVEAFPLDALGWVWPVLQDAPGTAARLEEIRKHVNNRVVETAGAANFTTDYTDQNYLLLGSNRRTDTILLDALMVDDPQSDLIPKLVTGLLAHKEKGRWNSTQENVFVLLALDRYFKTYEAQTPNFVARIWLGDAYVGSHEFRGRTTERLETTIPMSYLTTQNLDSQGTLGLVLSKEGDGRLYYRLGLSYAPLDLDLKPLEMGFLVQRRYEAVDNPADVTQDEQGIWHIKAGSRVRVRLTMQVDNRRYHVALVDPLPAGLEIINPALAVSGSTPQDPTASANRYGWWWTWTWYEHQNMRDERAEAFTPLLWDGVYEYTYIARATTPGMFIVPPAKAEEMYSPEVFGRSGSDRVEVY